MLEQHDNLSADISATISVFARGTNRRVYWRQPRNLTSHGASCCSGRRYSPDPSKYSPKAESASNFLLKVLQRNTTHTDTKTAVEKLVGKPASARSIFLQKKAWRPLFLPFYNSINILLNCAGVQRRPCHQFPSQEWNEVDIYALTPSI